MDGLQDLGLADQAVAMMKNENMVIRYWAVHCLTNPGIVTQLNAAKNSNQTSVFAAKFTEILYCPVGVSFNSDISYLA